MYANTLTLILDQTKKLNGIKIWSEKLLVRKFLSSKIVCLKNSVPEKFRSAWKIWQCQKNSVLEKFCVRKILSARNVRLKRFFHFVIIGSPKSIGSNSRHLPDIFQKTSIHLPDTFQTLSRHSPDTLQTPSKTLRLFDNGHTRRQGLLIIDGNIDQPRLRLKADH